MKFLTRIALILTLNGALLYFLGRTLNGFSIVGDLTTYLIGAGVLTGLNLIVKPILKIITLPLRWATLGLFNIVIYVALIWIADQLLPQLTIANFSALITASLVIGIANAIL